MGMGGAVVGDEEGIPVHSKGFVQASMRESKGGGAWGGGGGGAMGCWAKGKGLVKAVGV